MENRGTQTTGVMPYLLGLLRWKKQVLLFLAGVTVLAVVVSLVLPKWYRASTVLLLPKNQTLGSVGSLSMLLRDFAPTGAGGRLAPGSGQLNYLAILNSRRAGEEIIRRFDLLSVYGIDDGSIEDALEELSSNFSVDVQEDGSIGVEVFDRDSVRAAAMVNAMVEVLNEIAIDLGMGEARNTRIFLEKRLEETRTALTAAEEKLRAYQEKSGLMIISDEARAAATAIGELYARKAELDVKLAIIRKTAGEENDAYKQTALERSELGRKLSTFPEIGIESVRLFRDVMIQQKILEFLVPMYEQTRFEEHRDVPVVTVLDRGVTPERKARPKRMVIVAASALSALIVALLAVAAVVRFEAFRAEHPESYRSLTSALRMGRSRAGSV